MLTTLRNVSGLGTLIATVVQESIMRSVKISVTAVLIGATALSFSVPAVAAPLLNQANIANAAPSVTENVQYRRWHGGGHYHGGYRRGYGGGGAALGGLVAGAIIGGAIAAGQANAAAQQNAAYCAQRYRSYDPASGTYLNNDGNRYPCP
jgi:hypothetical protein